jgi:SprT-like family
VKTWPMSQSASTSQVFWRAEFPTQPKNEGQPMTVTKTKPELTVEREGDQFAVMNGKRRVALAYRKSDAIAFADGDITKGELTKVNKAFEAKVAKDNRERVNGVIEDEPNGTALGVGLPPLDSKMALVPYAAQRNYKTPTEALYGDLQKAFNTFNKELFEGKLPDVMITIAKARNKRGYFHPDQFKHRDDGDPLHEICLMPDSLDRPVIEALSTLAHEMVHLWQEEFGKPGKNGHHNEQWAKKMDEIGLTPSHDGREGGKRTGRNMTHIIVPGGPYDLAFAMMEAELAYVGQQVITKPKVKKKDLSKLVSICPECNAKAWSKQGLKLICYECEVTMEQEEIEAD